MIKDKYNDFTKVKAEFDSRLGEEASRAAWNYMVAEGNVSAVENGEHDTTWLVNKALSFLDAAGKSRLFKPRPEMMNDEQRKRIAVRLQALSVLWAEEAANDEQVEAFRKEVLKETLLDWESVGNWINEKSKSDGPGTTWLEVPVPPQYRLEFDVKAGLIPNPPLTISRKWGGRRSSLRMLSYALPSDKWSQRLPTASSGVLERLRVVAERLSQRYRWQQAQATTFILTGRIPVVHPSEATIERNSIILTVDPSLTPRQVADWYRRFRKGLLDGSRIKALSPKHLELATVVPPTNKSETWAKKMEEWNRRVRKEWRYSSEIYFRRDCLQARKRLLNPLPPPELRFLRDLEKEELNKGKKPEQDTGGKK